MSLYWLNPDTNNYELWSADDFQQENPQITDATGKYSFLVPPGYYYLTVQSEGYSDYTGKSFQLSQGAGVNINIQLVSKDWLARIFTVERVLMAIIILFLASILIVLFYLLKTRTKLTVKQSKI